MDIARTIARHIHCNCTALVEVLLLNGDPLAQHLRLLDHESAIVEYLDSNPSPEILRDYLCRTHCIEDGERLAGSLSDTDVRATICGLVLTGDASLPEATRIFGLTPAPIEGVNYWVISNDLGRHLIDRGRNVIVLYGPPVWANPTQTLAQNEDLKSFARLV